MEYNRAISKQFTNKHRKPKSKGYWYVLTDEEGTVLNIPCLDYFPTEAKAKEAASKAAEKHNAPDFYYGRQFWVWNEQEGEWQEDAETLG